MKHLLTILSLILICNSKGISQESQYNKVVERIYELRKISDEKQIKISELNNDIRRLSKKNATQRRKIEELQNSVKNKMSSILVLQSQMNDLTYEYEKLQVDIEKLGKQEKVFKSLIDTLTQAKVKLKADLMESNRNNDSLSVLLKTANLTNQLLLADKLALQKRIDELVNFKQRISFVELKGSAPTGYQINYTHGRLIKGKGGNMVVGPSSGISHYSSDDDSLDTYLVPLSIVGKISIGKEKLGFRYIDPEDKIIDQSTAFFSLEVGYSICIFDSDESLYNRGGHFAHINFGGIFNRNENANVLGQIGLGFQSIGYKRKNPDRKGRRDFWGFNIGVGIVF